MISPAAEKTGVSRMPQLGDRALRTHPRTRSCSRRFMAIPTQRARMSVRSLPVSTANQARPDAVGEQLHRFARYGQACFSLRTNRHPFDDLPERVSQIMIELMSFVITDMVAKETGTDTNFDFEPAHNSDKNAPTNTKLGAGQSYPLQKQGTNRQSRFSFRKPLPEPGTLLLCPVPFAVAADGHVLTAGGETFVFARGCIFLHFCAARLIYTASPGHIEMRVSRYTRR
jgi:hypothetical protein